ncbi:hypothetical protein AK812_SmicGene46082, partial [Symbiodinium microadriaticum]
AADFSFEGPEKAASASPSSKSMGAQSAPSPQAMGYSDSPMRGASAPAVVPTQKPVHTVPSAHARPPGIQQRGRQVGRGQESVVSYGHGAEPAPVQAGHIAPAGKSFDSAKTRRRMPVPLPARACPPKRQRKQQQQQQRRRQQQQQLRHHTPKETPSTKVMMANGT